MSPARPNRALCRRYFAGLVIGMAALAGCAEIEAGGSGHAASPTAPVNLGAGSADQAIATVTSQLASAGYTVLSTDIGDGVVVATTRSVAAIDCGAITQTYAGTQSTFPGNAPRAVVFAAKAPGGFVVRKVETTSHVAVKIRPGTTNTALIGERHRVRISQHSANRARLIWTETQVFDGHSTARFADGTTCSSSGATRQSLD